MSVDTLYVMVAIIDLIICITLAYIGLSREMSTVKFFGLLTLATCLSLFIVIVSAENIKRTDNIDTYNVSVASIQNIERQTSGDRVKYTDDSGNKNKVVISATAYDSDKTYIEMKRYKWWFLYEDKNILHMGLNYEDIQKNIEKD
jgi:hypothetical protein